MTQHDTFFNSVRDDDHSFSLVHKHRVAVCLFLKQARTHSLWVIASQPFSSVSLSIQSIRIQIIPRDEAFLDMSLYSFLGVAMDFILGLQLVEIIKSDTAFLPSAALFYVVFDVSQCF